MTGAEVAVAAALAPEIIGATAAGTAAATGATAAGLGAAGTAAGTAAALTPTAMALGEAGAGLLSTGMGGVGGMLGATEAAPLASTLLAPGAVAPSFTEAAAAAGAAPLSAPPMAGGLGLSPSAMFGSGASPLPAGMSMEPPGAGSFPWAKMAGQMGKQLMGGDQQQQATHAQRPPQGQSPQMSNQEILARLKMAQAGRSNFAGLLGRFQ